jgi:hypothetical protein
LSTWSGNEKEFDGEFAEGRAQRTQRRVTQEDRLESVRDRSEARLEERLIDGGLAEGLDIGPVGAEPALSHSDKN